MKRAPSGQALDLLAAGKPAREHGSARRGLERREQREAGDALRCLVELGAVAERARHAAAPGVRRRELEPRAAQELDLGAGAPERLLVAMRMHEDLALRPRRVTDALQMLGKRSRVPRKLRRARIAGEKLMQLVRS